MTGTGAQTLGPTPTGGMFCLGWGGQVVSSWGASELTCLSSSLSHQPGGLSFPSSGFPSPWGKSPRVRLSQKEKQQHFCVSGDRCAGPGPTRRGTKTMSWLAGRVVMVLLPQDALAQFSLCRVPAKPICSFNQSINKHLVNPL